MVHTNLGGLLAHPRGIFWGHREGFERVASADDLLHLQETRHGQHILHIVGAQAQLSRVHELQNLAQACRGGETTTNEPSPLTLSF